MYSLYTHIVKNNTGDISAVVTDKFNVDVETIGGFSITSYIPIATTDIIKFVKKLAIEVKEVFLNTRRTKTDVFYITISRKKSRVFTFFVLKEDAPQPYKEIAKVVLKIPELEWETFFNILEELRDFFQENLC